MDISASMASLQVSLAQRNAPGAAEPSAARSAAEEFEKMFLTQMVDEMMKQVDMGDFGGGQAAEQWRFFLSEAFAGELAREGGLGLADSLTRRVEDATAAYGRASRSATASNETPE